MACEVTDVTRENYLALRIQHLCGLHSGDFWLVPGTNSGGQIRHLVRRMRANSCGSDFGFSIRRNPRVPPELQEKYERTEFVSIINGNLLRAFSLLLFALLGLLFAIGRLIVR